jgi:hypothetical protein
MDDSDDIGWGVSPAQRTSRGGAAHGTDGQGEGCTMTLCVGDEDGNAQLNAVVIGGEAGEDACARRRSLCRRGGGEIETAVGGAGCGPWICKFRMGSRRRGKAKKSGGGGGRGSGGRRQAEQVVERLHAAKKVTHVHESGRTATHTLTTVTTMSLQWLTA